MKRKGWSHRLPRFFGVLEELESRLLFNADLAALSGLDPLAGTQPATSLPATQETATLTAGQTPAGTTAYMSTQASSQVISTQVEIVFVDRGVKNAQDLIADIVAQQDGSRTLEIHWLDSARDGAAQITETLQGRDNVAALHILSHGRDGMIQLGSTWLSHDNLSEHAADVAAWGLALTADADLMVYGCDVAASDAGRSLLSDIALLTGADVAGSSDATGSADLGGDWTLEFAQGQIESQNLVASPQAMQWQGLLALNPSTGETVVNTTTTGAQATTNAHQVAMNSSGGYVVIWNQSGTIMAKLFDASGAIVKNEFTVGTGTSAKVAMNDSGAFGVTYINNSGHAVFQRYDAAGTAQGAAITVAQYSTNGAPSGAGRSETFIRTPDIAITNTGEFIIVYSQESVQDNSAFYVEYVHTIAFKAYTAAGVQQSTRGSATVYTVSSDTYGRSSAYNSSIGMDSATGVFTIAWTTGGASTQDVVSARSYLATRATSGAAFTVQASTSNVTVAAPVVAVNSSGQAVIAWTRTTSGNSDIYFRRATGAGATIGSQTMAHASATNNQTSPDVAVDRATGQFSIVYQDSSGSNDIYMTQYASDGTLQVSNTIVNVTATGSQTIPSVARNGGMAVVIWTGPSTTTDVYARMYAGANNGPTLTATASNPSFTEGAGLGVQAAAVNVYSGAVASTVEGSQLITSLTFTVSGLVDGASERIVVDGTTLTLGANSSGTTATNGLSYTVTIASGTATVTLTHATGVAATAISTLVNNLSYQNTAVDTPTGGNRVFTLTQIKDNGGTADGGIDTTTLAIVSTVAVVTRNDGPTLSTTALSPAFIEAAGGGTQAAAVSLYSGTSVSTVESGQTITSLTFTVGGIVNGASERIVVDGTTITLGANSSGTTSTNGMTYNVTITSGTATVVLTKAAGITTSATQTLVDGITYQNTSTDNPTAGNRTFTLTQIKDSGGTANGGTDTSTLSSASTVTVSSVNDAPSLSATATNPTFTEAAGAGTQAAAVNVFSGASASAVESTQTLTSLTFTITGIVDGANERIAVDGVTITLGANSSGTTATNAMGYTVTISSGTATVTLTKAAGITTAAMQTLVNGITYQNISTDNPTAGARTFTLTQIKDNGGTANGGNDTTTLSTASTVTVVARNDAPTLTATASNPTFTEAAGAGTQAAAVTVFSGATASTVETGQSITSLTFTVSGLVDGTDERITVDGSTITLGANSSGTTTTNGMSYTVTISSGTATITLTKAAGISAAATQTLVNGITYQNTHTDSPTAGNRVFTFTQIKDDGGMANGGSDTTTLSFASTVAVVARNDAPTLTTTAANPTFTEAAGAGTQAAAVTVFGSTAVSTVESGQSITSLTFTVGGIVNGASERIVVDGSTITLGANSSGTTATNGMSYTVTISSGTATVVLTKAAGITTAATQTLVNGITYQNTSTDNPTAGNRTFTLTQIKDSGGSTNGGSDTTTLSAASTVTVVARNDAPTLTATGSNPTFTEAVGAGTQAAAVTLYSGTAISTVESGQTLTSLTFTVSGLVDGANERITVDGTALTLGGNSSGTTATNAMSYSVNVSGGTATVVLTKGAGISAAAMQTLVNGITYQNTSTDNPTAGSRVITLTQVKDSGGSANGGSDTTTLSIASTVNVVAANDAPVAVNDVVTIEVNTTADITVTNNDSDADNTTASLTVTIVSYSGGIVSATVNGDGTLHVVTGMSTGNETIVYYLTDGNGAQSSNATVNVSISASPPPSGTDASTTLVEDNTYTFTGADFGFVPVNMVQTFDGIQVVNVPTAGTLQLNGVTLIDGDVVSAAQIAAGQLVYTPATDGSGTPYTSFTFQVRDNFGTYAASTNTFTVDVTAVNDAPVLVNAIDFLAITEDGIANSGQLVSSLINSSDAENGSTNGVAVHGLSSGRGTWQYSIDGGGNWTSISAASDSSALLLRGSDYLRFVPDGDNADAATIDVYAWDGSTGSAGSLVDVSSRGGTTAFSLASDTASITVTAVNDAPVLTGSGNFAGITEDQTNGNGQLVSSLLTSTDVDSSAQQGMVISALQSGNGNWQYSLDGGTSWTNVGAVSDSAALLLADTDRIRFVPDGIDADAASLTFHAWDQSSGTAGSKVSVVSTGGTTAFSTASATASIAVSALNDAPVITGTSDFIAISEDATGGVGQLVSSLVGTSDVDGSPATGVAIHSQNAGNGTWQYSVDGGSTWSNVTGLSNATALLLRGSDRLRFLPDGLNADAPSLSFYAWDQTTGTAGTQADASLRGGTTAFSSVDGTSQLTVTAVNDAPVLTGTQPFTPITEDSVNNGGQLVSSLITTTDVDNGAVNGVAIYGQSAGNGTWQYSTNGGSTWNSIGSVTGNAALLLGASDRLRFIPDGLNAGAASLSYYAWDQSTGTAGSTADVTTRGGTTAFSTAAGTSTITVTAVNDAPTLSTSHDFTGITEDDIGNPGQLVSSLLDVTDVDTGAPTGVAIYGQTAGNGRWQFSTDGGSSWTDLGSVAGNAARLLRGTDHLRFVPDGLNADAASLSFYAWDQSSGSAGSLADAGTRGGTTAFSLTAGSSTITVSAVNDAPVIIGTSNFLTIDEDQINNNGQLVSSLYTATDVDTGALTGIAIDGTGSSHGQWQYSTDGGISWNSVGAVSDSSALLLRNTDRVRFVPDGFNGETATLSFRAWDQTTGSAGTRADVSSPGGASAFSASSTTSSLTITGVNEAPVLSGANNFNTVLEDDINSAGTRVTSLLGTFLSDVDDADQPGVAITAVDNSHGTWQYTTDGVTWLNVGNVSTNAARLLTGDSVSAVRFVPDADWTGTASITFQAWDGTSGTPGGLGDATVGGGTSAFSTAGATSQLTVFAVNDAPVLSGSSDFTGISEDDIGNATNPGRLVSSLFGSTDVDSGAVSGVAVYAQTGSDGKWQYSVDGNTWQDLGSVSSSSAMLLRSTDHLRFLPDGSRGTNASLSVYAWDQVSGTAGSTADVSLRGGANAFSTASGTTHIAVSDVNDVPVMSAITLSASAVPFTSWTTAALLDQAVDADGDVLSVSIVTGPSHGTLVQQPDGSWRYEGAIGHVGPDTFSYRAVDAQSQSVVIRTVQIDVVNPVQTTGGGQGTDGTGSGTGSGSGSGNASGDRPSPGNGSGASDGSAGTPGEDNTSGTPSWPDLGQGTDDEGEDAAQGGAPLSITEMIERIRSNANLGQISQEMLSGGRPLGLTPAYANFMQGSMAASAGSVMQLLELIKSNLALTSGDIDLQITPLNTVSHALPMEGTRPSLDAPGGSPIPTISLTKAASYSTGLGLSIGTIWWTARISGLLTSALISTPAWRSLDPLPVVTSPHDDDPDQGDAGHDDPGDPDKDVEHLFDADRPMEAELPVIE